VPFPAEIRRALKAVADPAVRTSYEWYFKGKLPFIGVRTPRVRQLFRELVPPHATYPVDRAIVDAFALLRAATAEEKHIGILLLHRYRRGLPEDFLLRLEPVFDDAVHEWGTCDGVCGRVLRHLLVRSDRDRRRIIAWSGSPNQWRQRASAVAFVNEARHGEYTAGILEVCERTVNNPERFVQLGTGWVLRELWLAEPRAVIAFLRRHYHEFSREGLRYAIEKMPANEQAALLAEHKASGAPGAARGARRLRTP
jgi:3-methyladenine DNA glycosylase AlkD